MDPLLRFIPLMTLTTLASSFFIIVSNYFSSLYLDTIDDF